MSDEQRGALRELLKGGQAEREIPFARPDSLTQVIAVASGKGRWKVISHGEPRQGACCRRGVGVVGLPISMVTRCRQCSAWPTRDRPSRT